MSNEVETYLAAYNQADSLASELKQIATSIGRVARALKEGSSLDCTQALSDYPTANEIRAQLDQLDEAKQRVQGLWDAVPPELQFRLPRPDRVGRPRTEVSFNDAE
jgi:hypothetical protein